MHSPGGQRAGPDAPGRGHLPSLSLVALLNQERKLREKIIKFLPLLAPASAGSAKPQRALAGRSQKTPLPPWDLLRRYLAAARFLMERGLSFPGSLLFFARTDNARPITYFPFAAAEEKVMMMRRRRRRRRRVAHTDRGPGTRQARARCTGRLTRDPASMVHPRVVVHTPPDAVSNAHPRPFPTTSPSPPTSQSATGGGTSPRPWSNRGGEGGRDGGGTFDIVARRVSSRLITDGGALDAWCAPVTRVGS